jgi:iron complex transport system permease protein
VILRILLLLLLVTGIFLLSACIGEVPVSPPQVLSAFFSTTVPATDDGTREILMQIRIPRVLTAALVGAALSASGFLLQSLSNNYLADPYLTGVSSGAGLAVAICMIAGANFAFLPVAALLGGIIAASIVSTLAKTATGISMQRLLLSGVALSAVCSGVTTLLICMAGGSVRAQGIYYWIAGSVGGRTWSELGPAAFYVAVGMIVAFVMSKPLRLLSVGQTSAASLGLNVARSQGVVLASAVLLCGAAVSLSGLVGFVGMIAPYLARKMFGRDERLLMFSSGVLGAALVMLSDLAARTLTGAQELPLSTLLSLIGGPFFLFLIFHHDGRAE